MYLAYANESALYTEAAGREKRLSQMAEQLANPTRQTMGRKKYNSKKPE